MTKDEAVKLCSIIQYADGGCSHCVSSLMEAISNSFPGIDWREAFNAGFKDSYDTGSWMPEHNSNASTSGDRNG